MRKTGSQGAVRNGRRGATIVEFALVFLLFITMVAGLFEVGRAIWAYNTLMYAAKEGARYAMVHGSRNPIPPGGQSISDYTKSGVVGISPESVQTAISYSPDNQPGSQVTVTASHTLNFVVAPLVGLGSSITLSGSSTKTILN